MAATITLTSAAGVTFDFESADAQASIDLPASAAVMLSRVSTMGPFPFNDYTATNYPDDFAPVAIGSIPVTRVGNETFDGTLYHDEYTDTYHFDQGTFTDFFFTTAAGVNVGIDFGQSLSYANMNGRTIASFISDGTEVDGSQQNDHLFMTDFSEIVHAGPGDDVVSGRGGNDQLFGEDGNDTLDGGTGNDRMVGGAGDDTYIVDSAGDTVVELNGDGKDRVISSVDYTLPLYVENLTLTGSAKIGIGNSLANVIVGNAGPDQLNGLGGKDTLTGGAGKDWFVFTTKPGPSNADKITDFSVKDDGFRLDNAVFKALTGVGAGHLGRLGNGELVLGNAATNPDQHLIYNPGNGQLRYDADGSGHAASVLFATLAAHLHLTTADFFVI